MLTVKYVIKSFALSIDKNDNVSGGGSAGIWRSAESSRKAPTRAWVPGVRGSGAPVMNGLRLVQAFNTCCVPTDTRFKSYTKHTTCDNKQLLQRSFLSPCLGGTMAAAAGRDCLTWI